MLKMNYFDKCEKSSTAETNGNNRDTWPSLKVNNKDIRVMSLDMKSLNAVDVIAVIEVVLLSLLLTSDIFPQFGLVLVFLLFSLDR